jgi:hypothetical protein
MLLYIKITIVSKMYTVNIKDIPNYLQNSKLYKKLIEQNKSEIMLDWTRSIQGYDKADFSDIETFNHFLSLCEYFRVNTLSHDILRQMCKIQYNNTDTELVVNDCYLSSTNQYSMTIDKYPNLPFNNDLILLVEHGINSYNEYKISNILDKCAESGCSNLLEFGIQDNWNVTNHSCYLACKNNHLDCVKLLVKNRNYNKDCMLIAARNNNLEIIKYLYSNGCEWHDDTIITLTNNENIDALKYCIENDAPIELNSYVSSVCKELEDKQIFIKNDAFVHGASELYFECIEYLIEKGCFVNSESLVQAAEHGDIELLKYIYELRCKYPNHLEYKFEDYDTSDMEEETEAELKKDPDYIPDDTSDDSVSENEVSDEQTNKIEELENNNSGTNLPHAYRPWHKYVTLYCAKFGHLKCLQFAHENGCPWASDTIYEAILSDNFDCFEYALNNDAPVKDKHINFAARMSNMVYIKTLLDRGYGTTPATLIAAIESDNINCVKYLVRNEYETLDNCSSNPVMLDIAVDDRALKTIKYLIKEENYIVTEAHFNDLAHDTCINDKYRKQVMDEIVQIVTYLHQSGGWRYEEIEQGDNEPEKKIYRAIDKCPWSATTTLYAAKQGNYELLKYLHESGCPWNSSIFKLNTSGTSKYSGDISVCKAYAYNNKCPGWWYSVLF